MWILLVTYRVRKVLSELHDILIEADMFEVFDGVGFEAAAFAKVAVEMAREVNAFAGFAVAGEDSSGLGWMMLM